MGAAPPLAIVLVVVLVLDIERGLGMQCRNDPRARIDGTPNALGEAFLEDEGRRRRRGRLSRGLARASIRERIRAVTDRYPWLVAVSKEDVVLGYAYAGKHRERSAYRWSADFTAYLAPAAKRRGIGTKLYTALAEICRQLGYYRAFAGITLPNEASIRLHEKIGFRPIGVYQTDLPGEPRSIREIVDSPSLKRILNGD